MEYKHKSNRHSESINSKDNRKDDRRKRDRSKDRSSDRYKDNEKYRDKERDRNKDRDRDREKERDRDRERIKERVKDKERNRDKSRDKYRDRSRDKDRDKSRIKDKERKSIKKSKSRSRSNQNYQSKDKRHSYSKHSSKRSNSKSSKSPSHIKSSLDQPKFQKASNFSSIPNEFSQADLNNLNQSNLNALTLAQTSKVDRKLYIGNLPVGITSATLVKLLNTALLTVKGSFAPGDPVISAWISVDGHYAFVEFRTAEEANQGFLLNNIVIMGQPLKVGRPKTYSGVLTMMDDNAISNTVAAALQGGTMNAPITGKKVQFPTRILCFKSIIKDINIDDDDVYKEVEEDIRYECNKYCNVLNVFMPRKDIEDNATPGMGNAYVEFNTVDDSKEVRKQLVGRRFNMRTIQMVYFPEDKYIKRDYSIES